MARHRDMAVLMIGIDGNRDGHALWCIAQFCVQKMVKHQMQGIDINQDPTVGGGNA